MIALGVLRGRKKRQFERGPPPESSVKGGQRVRVSFGKSGQVGIRPGTRSNAGLGHELAPGGIDTVRLGRVDQPPIGTQLLEGLPCLEDSPRSSSHYFGIRQQTKQAHLGYPAEGDGSVRLRGEPVARRHVVNVALSGERNPYVDIRQ
jgi:hypothetical protein